MVVSNQDIFGRFSGMPQNNEAEMTQLTPTRSTLSVHVLLQKTSVLTGITELTNPHSSRSWTTSKQAMKKRQMKLTAFAKRRLIRINCQHPTIACLRHVQLQWDALVFFCFFFTSVWVRKTFLKATLQLRPRKKSHSTKDQLETRQFLHCHINH